MTNLNKNAWLLCVLFENFFWSADGFSNLMKLCFETTKFFQDCCIFFILTAHLHTIASLSRTSTFFIPKTLVRGGGGGGIFLKIFPKDLLQKLLQNFFDFFFLKIFYNQFLLMKGDSSSKLWWCFT